MSKRTVELSKPICNEESLLCVFETCLMLVESGLKLGSPVELKMGRVRVLYPTLSYVSNRRFARYLRVLGVIRDQMGSGAGTVSKRGLYYLDVRLFEKQRVVDDIVDVIANSLGGVELSQLCLRAVEKGLYSIGGSSSQLIGTESILQDDFKRLVVIEKESVFTNVIKGGNARPDTVYVTGRGFPDRMTVAFVDRIRHRALEIECIVDCDVYGVLIANQYRLTPSEGWLLFDGGDGDFLNVTRRDVSMLFGAIGRASESQSLRELQRQLFHLVKREIEC